MDDERLSRITALKDAVEQRANPTTNVPAVRVRQPALAAPAMVIQTKLEVGSADDPLEREADQVARHVVATLGNRARDSGHPGVKGTTGGRIRRFSIMPVRAPHTEAEPRVQRRTSIGADGGELDPQTAGVVQREIGRGQPLNSAVRESMESAFGNRFDRVRVHTDDTSVTLNRKLQASAFTVGSDVFFGDANPDVSSPPGQELLAHELTHVVQQSGGSARPDLDARKMIEGAHHRADGGGSSRTQSLVDQAVKDDAEEQRERQSSGARSKVKVDQRAKGGPDNENYRGGILGLGARAVYGVKALVKTLPDVAVNRMMPDGPNGTAHVGTAYGICDTEAITDGDLKVTAKHDDNEWHPEVTKIVAHYSKVLCLPPGMEEVTGPGGGGPGATTLANSVAQITCLLATEGPPWYMIDAVDGHESVHEERLLPAIRAIAPEVQQNFAAVTVPYVSKDAAPVAGSYSDESLALAAIKALPAYATAVASILQLWDVKYDALINDDHKGKAQKGEEKVTRPMINKINKFRKQNDEKAIPVKYTWQPY